MKSRFSPNFRRHCSRNSLLNKPPSRSSTERDRHCGLASGVNVSHDGGVPAVAGGRAWRIESEYGHHHLASISRFQAQRYAKPCGGSVFSRVDEGRRKSRRTERLTK